jgi:hypothetical protein
MGPENVVADPHGHRFVAVWLVVDICFVLRGGAIYLYLVLNRHENHHY